MDKDLVLGPKQDLLIEGDQSSIQSTWSTHTACDKSAHIHLPSEYGLDLGCRSKTDLNHRHDPLCLFLSQFELEKEMESSNGQPWPTHPWPSNGPCQATTCWPSRYQGKTIGTLTPTVDDESVGTWIENG